MSHTWHKVLHAARRRNCILMRPLSVRMMGPSCVYVRTSHRAFAARGSRRGGGMEKQLLFSNIPMLAIMCQTNKSGKIEAHSYDAPPAGKQSPRV